MENIITLSNGKRVANFSSPHPFTFEDDNILPAVSNDKAERLKVKFIEKDKGNGDIELSFELTLAIVNEMIKWQTKYLNKEVDVVFCPLPMITAIKLDSDLNIDFKDSPFRSIRVEDRIKKLISIHKQCI
jgi:hypothetical protein